MNKQIEEARLLQMIEYFRNNYATNYHYGRWTVCYKNSFTDM